MYSQLRHCRTQPPLQKSARPFYICLLHQFVPLAHDRSLLRAWIYPAPFDGPHSWFTRWTRPITQPFRTRLAAHVVRRIFRQDIRVCERLQAAAHQVGKAPRLGALEERIAWFEESYRRLLADNVSGLGEGIRRNKSNKPMHS